MNDEQILKLLRSKAKHALLGELMSGICHELNNPLTIIMGNIGILEKYLKKDASGNIEKLLGFTSEISLASVRIQKIVSTLRSIAKSDFREDVSSENLLELMDQAQILLKTKLVRERIELKYNNNFPKVIISCHQGQIVEAFIRVILDLIENQKELPKKSLTFTSSIEKNELSFQVENPIPMISKESFDIFSPLSMDFGHDGLSLSLAQEILIQNHGQLNYLKNSSYEGFEIRLPIKEQLP